MVYRPGIDREERVLGSDGANSDACVGREEAILDGAQ